jgi:hypothetical protein
MSFTVKIDRGSKGVMDVKFKQLPKAMTQEGMEALIDVAVGIRNEMISSMHTSPPTGELNTRLGGRRSSPGNPPRPDSNKLIENILLENTGKLTVRVGVLEEVGDYPVYLEEGTPKGQMEARPYMEPALELWSGKVENLVMQGIIKGAERVIKR